MWTTYDPAAEAQRYAALQKELTVDGRYLYPGRLLQRAARSCPDGVAIIFRDRSITYGELYRRV